MAPVIVEKEPDYSRGLDFLDDYDPTPKYSSRTTRPIYKQRDYTVTDYKTRYTSFLSDSESESSAESFYEGNQLIGAGEDPYVTYVGASKNRLTKE